MPDDVVQYAAGYDRHDLMLRYCPDCPIGRNIWPKATDRDLPWASMRVSQRLRKGAAYADRLDEIADDGIIDEHELPDFHEIVNFLRNLEETTADVILWALSNGFLGPEMDKKMEPPCANRDGSVG